MFDMYSKFLNLNIINISACTIPNSFYKHKRPQQDLKNLYMFCFFINYHEFSIMSINITKKRLKCFLIHMMIRSQTGIVSMKRMTGSHLPKSKSILKIEIKVIAEANIKARSGLVMKPSELNSDLKIKKKEAFR